jgi:signal transduction histidine kinase
VLLGGDAADRNLDPFAWPLAYVTSSLGLEADCEVARAHLVTARQAEVEARALALALDRSRQDLRQALEQAREARDRLARELATRDEFLAAVAHDLKNPLTAIKGIAQILRRRVASRNISDVNWLGEGLATLDATATRMTGQLDQLLDLTRLRLGGPLELDRRPLDLAELVRRVADVFQKTTERHDLRVETPAELVGEWDPVRLERVVTNLISNAVKYSPDGGVIRVALRCEEADGRPWAVLSIEDQGMGISAADLPAIFERFHRGANTVGRVAGSGIGLASARHMVERHGGSIGVASELGRGSTFTVRLPLTPIEPGPEV